MLTKIKIKNFKKLDDVEIELGKSVVLIGPNNSGKTTALQALSLWETGLRSWQGARAGKDSPKKRPGVNINRKDLISVPMPEATLLWLNKHVREGQKNIRIEITVEGLEEKRELSQGLGEKTLAKTWSCGFEFDYDNKESFICRPLRLPGFDSVRIQEAEFSAIPKEAEDIRISLLPPMSGLAASEPKWEPGRINVLLGEGQTAQVLRNLCHQIHAKEVGGGKWPLLVSQVRKLFGVELLPPRHNEARGEITMGYKEPNGTELDLSSSGRGLQQTLLLLAYLYSNPSTVLLLDEPDAHLEILRQRQIYQILAEAAHANGSQVICASHSEVVLNEAADRDIVVSFVGKPRRINDRDRGSQILKSLRDIGWEEYFKADQKGWVLYLEGSTDLAILKAFADTLGHDAAPWLEQPFFHYVGNQPKKVQQHFWGLKHAKTDLTGLAIFDRLEDPLPDDMPLPVLQWRRRELENYLCMEEVLLAYARSGQPDDLIGRAESERAERTMRSSIEEVSDAVRKLNRGDPWSPDIKASSDFLDPLFTDYFRKLKMPNLLAKSSYYVLAKLVPKEKIDSDVLEKLDAIVVAGKKAKPRKA